MNSFGGKKKMEFDTLTDNRQPSTLQRLFPAVVPVVFIAISYVDPGKWAAAVEGGAHFGVDLVFPVLIFNFAAILCQYLSARIAVVTGRDLAQICSEEYDKITCMLLGVQAEISIIALDLMMVLGTAHGLNVLFGIDLFTGVFLTALNAALFPLLATVLENSRAKYLSICISIFVLVSYIFGVLVSQPASPLPLGGTVTRLSGESAFALMSLLGASIMPHNFYLHSSVVQLDQGPNNVPKETLYHDHFFAIFCIFSGIFLVNYVLMNSAANVFYSTGLLLLTFQDALSLLDQAFRSSIASFCLIMLMFLLSQVTALTWNLSGQVVVRELFKMDIPGWLHHATIRIIAIIPALYCVWNSGAEGIYQLLIFTQVVVSLMLPSSVIPLFRVASSRQLMGIHKISQREEFLALITFIGMLGLKIIFFIELVFGDSDWVSNLRWNIGSSVPVAYVTLLLAASVSFFLMLWLAATPLKSATSRTDAQALDLDMHPTVLESGTEGEQNDVLVPKYQIDKPTGKQEPPVTFEKSLGSSRNLSLPETIFDSENVLPLTTIEENKSEVTIPSPGCSQEASPIVLDRNLDAPIHGDISDGQSQNSQALKTDTTDLAEKTLQVERDIQTVKDDGESWELEEPTKEVPEMNQSLTSEGSGSFRSLSGKSDDVGSGTGSLSRLGGLGRAARRQFAAALDEFWGQMFDLHGQATKEAKAKKLDLLLGLDLKLDAKSSSASVKSDSSRADFTGCFPSLSGQGSDSLISSSLYNSPRQQMGQSLIEPSFGVQRGSSPLLSSPVQLLGAYVRNSSRNTHDSGERRYSSMHIPASSDGYDQQPVTVHGHELASYLNWIAKETGSGILNGQMESPAPISTSSMSSSFRESFARPVGKRPQNGMSISRPPGFHNVSVSRNNFLQSERSMYDVTSPKPTENPNSSINLKKFYSLPDISGFRVPYQESTLSDKSGKWDNSMVNAQSVGSTYDRTSLTVSSRTEAPPGFHGRSPSKVCREPFSLQFSSRSSTGSLWSRQPYEQFGVADRTHAEGEQVKGSYAQESASAIDFEARLLQSFRHSVVKLLKLEGSDWLFRQNGGADEDLIDRVAAREKFLYEAETVPMNWPSNVGEAQFYSDRKSGSAVKSDDTDYTKFSVTSVPHCGEDCVYKVDLIISFGVWCIHRIFELLLMESRPELWGKYTYVLNRLQGIVVLAFFRPRTPMTPCFCLQLPAGWQQKSSPPISNGSLPPPAKQSRGKCTTAASLLDIIKDIEVAISCRKGRTGTAAGDVAFPKGKENLASVLKRYKRHLSNKPIGSQDGGSGSRKVSSSLYYGL
ncbi:ethylene-insensitive protein 2 [Coffea eugenioides]|uniref:Ethylene-insensitive protein 2 isoform X2 n=1 Tax=Coffea arabica TaxID=13443 RepID=A0A6P6SYT8_COFAR|nr:ethylene-insensitive protein 2 isoform X2 [Coffea arabica]XP_027070987.1 ethylene-insensitive protein 2 isoform X2 [Coffea arabica]XP_027070988.1 ethylene-insensitive protein 2 isoform X2 [Coffea arabica]XP_027177041.1 ethylene-insensitive protein 2 [Coffea eugenioides]XP_027177042.1 ethylene-insensitive protein 2 [Coffea eugenioides]XP_027177043.1 ethylene-insensitive protein 2 [Coffea eugenioides]